MLIEIIEILVRPGSGFIFSSLLSDIILLVITTYLVWNNVLPIAKARRQGKMLDKVVGTEEMHWLYGHTKKYGFNKKEMKNGVNRTTKFPTWFNSWYTPVVSAIQTYHPDVSSSLLNSGAPKNESIYKTMRPWTGDGLLTSKGKKWLRNRRLLTPAFHSSVLQPYTVSFNDCVRTLIDKWENKVGIPVEVSEPVSLMTLDTLLHCTMSSDTNCQHINNHSYLKAVHDLTDTLVIRVTTPIYYFDWIFYRTKTGQRFKKACDVVHSHTEKVIAERRKILQKLQSQEHEKECDENHDDVPSFMKRGKKSLDLLDILLQTKDEDGKGLTDIEIRDEVDTVVFAGHDTTASGIYWALYNLAKYPEYQEKCREEITTVIGDKENVEWNDLSKLSYLTMFLKESMRLYPPAPSIGRRLEKPLTIRSKLHKLKEVIIPKDSNMGVYIFALHRNAHVWENPKVFDPERFTKENQAKRSPHAYVPFSAGSRNCIGQNFAMNEMKVVLAQLLRRYRLYLDEETPKPQMQAYVVLRSANGIWVKLKPV